MNIREFIIKKKREEASETFILGVGLYCISLFFLFIFYAVLYSFVKDNAIYGVLIVGIVLVIIFFKKAYPWGLDSYISSVEKGNFTYSLGTCTGVTETNGYSFIKTDLGEIKTKDEIKKGDRVLIVEVNGSKSIYNVSDINLTEDI